MAFVRETKGSGTAVFIRWVLGGDVLSVGVTPVAVGQDSARGVATGVGVVSVDVLGFKAHASLLVDGLSWADILGEVLTVESGDF